MERNTLVNIAKNNRGVYLIYPVSKGDGESLEGFSRPLFHFPQVPSGYLVLTSSNKSEKKQW